MATNAEKQPLLLLDDGGHGAVFYRLMNGFLAAARSVGVAAAVVGVVTLGGTLLGVNVLTIAFVFLIVVLFLSLWGGAARGTRRTSRRSSTAA